MLTRITHHVPSLRATITGELDQEVACFRGIPYATLEKRWTHSQTNHTLESPFDATEYGPRCPQAEGQVLVTGGVNDPTPGDDEFRCLNLNVAVPQEALKTKAGLPVMVWIHGGAFNYGANSVARYRPIQLSRLAKAHGNSIILVQIQYRLGPLGFAASNDIRSEQSSLRSSTSSTKRGPNITLGNFGLVDQIHALEWVRDHIHDFGGDANNVTVFGVSAGSASIHHHILTGSPLFDRAILMSGSAPTLGPLPLSLYEQAWHNFLLRAGGFEDLKTPEERLERARSLTTQDLNHHYTSAAMGPAADGELLPASWQYNEPQKPLRCKEIIIGDTKIEAIIMDGLINSISQAKFTEIVLGAMPDPDGFLHAFGFKPEMDQVAFRDSMRCWLSVAMFQYPNILVAKTFLGKVYFYHFDEPSPYPGPTFGLPYHGQCALFVYQNGNSQYPLPAKATAENMGKIWTAFASNGEGPWEEFSKAERFMGFGPGGEMVMKNFESDHAREYKWLAWVEKNFESLKKFTQDLTCKV